jgi:DNA-binding transcriptional MerR regulator
MPREIGGKRYYETTEVCRKAGISRPTLFRWLKRGIVSKMRKDRRGWRLFTEQDLNKIQAEARKIVVDHVLVRPRDRREL